MCRVRPGTTTALAAQVYFWARVVYLPLYGAGVPKVRTLVWAIGTLAIVTVLGVSLFG